MVRAPAARRIKGVNLIGLVKLINALRKKRPVPGISPAGEALLAEHVLISDWYAFEPFIELVGVVYREILARSESGARQMGVVGGQAALSGFHKQFIKVGDPMASLIAMRHTWRTYFDFGELTTEPDGPRAVRFVVSGYPDMPASHGQLIVGWHTSAAIVAGASGAKSEIVDCPWHGGLHLEHRVTF
jgi:hypothetical protein